MESPRSVQARLRKQNLQYLPAGARVRALIKAGFKFDHFECGMEGVVVENRQECRNFLVRFDASSVPVIVGYSYLESIDCSPLGTLENSPVDVPEYNTSCALPAVKGAVISKSSNTKSRVDRDVLAPTAPVPSEPETEIPVPTKPPSSQNPDPPKASPLHRRVSLRKDKKPFKLDDPPFREAKVGRKVSWGGSDAVDIDSECSSSDAPAVDIDGDVLEASSAFPDCIQPAHENDQSQSRSSAAPVSFACDERKDSESPAASSLGSRHIEEAGHDALQAELQQMTEALQILDTECIFLQEDVRDKDQTIKTQDAELASAQKELHLMKKLLGARDDELSRLRAQLQGKDKEIAALRGKVSCSPPTPGTPTPTSDHAKPGEDQQNDTPRRRPSNEIKRLRCMVEENSQQMRRLETAQEKELADAELFIQSLAQTSAQPVLKGIFDLQNMSILGKGCYGYITLCKSTSPDATEENVVMKWQSERWATVVMKEWAHGSKGKHPHIVEYMNVFMHADEDRDVEDCLKAGFHSGALVGRQPKKFPDRYFCIAVEYMDRGTVQNLMDQDILTLKSIGAITNQISSALAFMHSKKRTHNDIKPVNILLRSSKGSKSLLAKLADFGLANHSVDRKRDCELLGYTIWCMGLKEKFTKVPSGEASQAAALREFKGGSPATIESCDFDETLWNALHDTIDGMWTMTLEMHEVEDIDIFRPLQVEVPASAKKELEEAAKNDLHRRSTARHTLLNSALAHSCPVLPGLETLQSPTSRKPGFSRASTLVERSSKDMLKELEQSGSELTDSDSSDFGPDDSELRRKRRIAAESSPQAVAGVCSRQSSCSSTLDKAKAAAPDWSQPLQCDLDQIIKTTPNDLARNIMMESAPTSATSPCLSYLPGQSVRRQRSTLESGKRRSSHKSNVPPQQEERRHSVGSTVRGFLLKEKFGSFSPTFNKRDGSKSPVIAQKKRSREDNGFNRSSLGLSSFKAVAEKKTSPEGSCSPRSLSGLMAIVEKMPREDILSNCSPRSLSSFKAAGS